MASELKVCDLELACYSDLIGQWDKIDSVMDDYLKVLVDIRDNAIKSGEVHESVDLLHWYAKSTYEKMKGLGKMASSFADKFLKKIEDTDLNLYNGV